MSLYLENKDDRQEDVFSAVLSVLVEEEADMVIISEDGESIFCSRILFSIFSKTLRDILQTCIISDMPRISLPMSAGSIRSLITVLIEGRAVSSNREDLMGVPAAANLLDIDFKELQIGTKNVNNSSHFKNILEIDGLALGQTECEVADEECSKESGIQVSKEVMEKQTEIITNSKYVENDILSLTAKKRNHCEKCNKHFPDEKYLTLHKHMKHYTKMDSNVHCKECKEIFSSGTELADHMVLHTCHVCKTIFRQLAQLKVHMESHGRFITNVDYAYQCDFCEKSFKQIKYLKSHMVVHSGEKPFACNVCGRPFKRRNEMKKHKIKSCS